MAKKKKEETAHELNPMFPHTPEGEVPPESPAGEVSPDSPAAEAGDGKKLSKTAALTEALEALGLDAKNTDLEDYIRRKYGDGAVPGNLSVSKSSILKKMREANGQPPAPSKRGRKPGVAAATQPVRAVGVMGLADSLAGLRSLVKQVGIGEAEKLVRMFGGE